MKWLLSLEIANLSIASHSKFIGVLSVRRFARVHFHKGVNNLGTFVGENLTVVGNLFVQSFVHMHKMQRYLS